MRKLKEFQRWQRIANSLDLTYNELYQFDIENTIPRAERTLK
ncbi:hypothetical protein JavanS12_0003 [Streptococcus satellite phage Javan12]|nr:hypothetical protein JavanS12_0003 [Streptococcus satellite phage Javan12]